MQQFLDYYTFLSEILMYNKPVVIVEGKDDVNLVKILFNNADPDLKHVIVISPEIRGLNRKGIVIKALKDVNYTPQEKRSRYIGIVDSDFNEVNKTKENIPNLFYTDYHDFDTQIFVSKAFDKYLHYDYFEPENLDPLYIRSECFRIASEIGFYLLSLYDLNLHEFMNSFRKIERFLNDNLEVIFSKINDHLLSSLEQAELNNLKALKDIKAVVARRKTEGINPYDLANGHHLVRIFALLTLWEKLKLRKKGYRIKIKA